MVPMLRRLETFRCDRQKSELEHEKAAAGVGGSGGWDVQFIFG